MNKIIRKLEKKYPESEIRISDGKIRIFDPKTGIEKFIGKSSGTISEVRAEKNPLFKSSSWINVSTYGGFKDFGKKSSKKPLTGDQLGRFFQKLIDEDFQEKELQKHNLKIKRDRNETIIANILDTGNHRGEILGKTDYEIMRKKRCMQILLNMKSVEEKVIKFKK